ncbi:MAG: cytochrome c oxidase assembly protein [Micavibrio sp.]
MDKNTRILLMVFGGVILMTGLAFASVPLYRLFCQVTGFAGTTMIAESAPDYTLDRTITVKFVSNTARGMNWSFKPEMHEQKVKLGQQGLIAFMAENRDKMPVAGTAIYNVTPNKAGQYFQKTQCFCFDEQILKAGEKMQMPVMYFIDPKLDEDRNMDDVTTITLSYTFFPAHSEELDKAMEEFYNADVN